MPVLVYTGEGEFPNPSEREQFREVLDKIKSEFGNSFERIHVCYNFISSMQIDMLIILKKGLIDIELKSYEGEVMGGENGPWYVKDKDQKIRQVDGDRNVFGQCKEQRDYLFRNFKSVIPSLQNQKIKEEVFRAMIDSWACFKGDSKYVERLGQGNVDMYKNRFFRIVNTNNIIENIQDVLENSKHEFSEGDIDSIIKALGLKQVTDDIPPNPPHGQRNATQYMEIIMEFEEEIKQEKLDLNKAKEWIFQLSLNVYHTYTPLANMEDFTELKFLVFIGIIREVASYDRKATIYKYSYYIKNDDKSMNLARAIIDERIEERKNKLFDIVNKYEERYFLISMLRGEFEKLGNTNEFLLKFRVTSYNDFNYVPDLDDEKLKGISKSLGIDEKLLYAMYVAAHSPQMKEKSREIYEELLKAGLGLGSHIREHGEDVYDYSFPVSQLLKKLNLENITRSISFVNLKEYAKWQMVKSSIGNDSTLNLELLRNKLERMGIDDLDDLKIHFKKLFEQGDHIISNPESSYSKSKILILDEKGFYSYCDEIMAELVGKI